MVPTLCPRCHIPTQNVSPGGDALLCDLCDKIAEDALASDEGGDDE